MRSATAIAAIISARNADVTCVNAAAFPEFFKPPIQLDFAAHP